jgi:hypothetical protein
VNIYGLKQSSRVHQNRRDAVVVQGQQPWLSVRLIVMMLSYSLGWLPKVLVTKERVTARAVCLFQQWSMRCSGALMLLVHVKYNGNDARPW